MVLVSLVSFVSLKDSEQITVPIRMKKEKYYKEIVVSSQFTSICNIDGYTKHIHKRTTHKTVPVSIVSIMCSENSRQKRFFVRLNVTVYLTSWD